MNHIKKLLEYLKKIWELVIEQSRKIRLPFFKGLSLYDVATFFFKGLFEGSITTRAGSISWSFFLALFPGIIFIFNLIPYIPIPGFQTEIFAILEEVLPPNTYEATRTTIEDILNNRRADLLSFTFLFAIFFATNGTLSLISNVSITFHQIESRVFWMQYVVALGLTVILGLLVIIGSAVVLFSSNLTMWLVEHDYFPSELAGTIPLARYAILMFVMWLSIALIFYYGPTKKKEWGFFSPGASLAVLLIIISSVAFSFYVTNFSMYNKLYGSIGTLLVIMLWIYINSIGLVVGFELNASIAGARKRRNRLDSLE